MSPVCSPAMCGAVDRRREHSGRPLYASDAPCCFSDRPGRLWFGYLAEPRVGRIVATDPSCDAAPRDLILNTAHRLSIDETRLDTLRETYLNL